MHVDTYIYKLKSKLKISFILDVVIPANRLGDPLPEGNGHVCAAEPGNCEAGNGCPARRQVYTIKFKKIILKNVKTAN